MGRELEMNKHIVNVLKDFDFTYKGRYGHGHINGYEVNVVEKLLGQGTIFLFATYLSQIQKNDFITKLNSHRFKSVRVFYNIFGVGITICGIKTSSFEKKYNEVMSAALSILAELEAPKSNICPQSGEQMDESNSKFVEIERINLTLSNSSIETINTSIENALNNYEAQPNHYFKGFLGLLIGALAGVAVSVMIYFWGYISSVGAILSIFLGAFLYEKLGGKKTGVMVIMCLSLTVISALLAFFGLYLYGASSLEIENLTLFQKFIYCCENLDGYKRAFLINLGNNVLFLIIAGVCAIPRFRQMLNKPKKIEVK